MEEFSKNKILYLLVSSVVILLLVSNGLTAYFLITQMGDRDQQIEELKKTSSLAQQQLAAIQKNYPETDITVPPTDVPVPLTEDNTTGILNVEWEEFLVKF